MTITVNRNGKEVAISKVEELQFGDIVPTTSGIARHIEDFDDFASPKNRVFIKRGENEEILVLALADIDLEGPKLSGREVARNVYQPEKYFAHKFLDYALSEVNQ